MRKFIMRYPGDPDCRVTEMTRAEFIARHPRSPIVMSDGEGNVLETIPMQPDEVHCDLCNADPGDTVVEMVGGRSGRVVRGYCKGCAKESWYPYCVAIS